MTDLTVPRHAFRGHEEARHRLEVALDAGDDEGVVIAVCEVLQWLYMMGEWWKDRLGRNPFFSIRLETAEGETAAALEWARGFTTHALSAPGEERELYPSEDLYPSDDLFPGNTWRWRSLPDKNDRGRGRDELYRRRVAHRELYRPLDAALRFFEGLSTEGAQP